jgi:hypothetical protein
MMDLSVCEMCVCERVGGGREGGLCGRRWGVYVMGFEF